MTLTKKNSPIVKRRIFTLKEDINLLKSCVKALAEHNLFKTRQSRTKFWNKVFLYFCKENAKNKTVRHLRKRTKVLYKYFCKKKKESVETADNISENESIELETKLFNNLLLVVFEKIYFNSKGCIEFTKSMLIKTHKTPNFTNAQDRNVHSILQKDQFEFFCPYEVSFSLDIIDEWNYYMRTNDFLRKLNENGMYLTAAETMKLFHGQTTKNE